VGTAGDVNGDGYADIIVGAYLHDSGEMNEGRANVYLGNGGAGVPLVPRQLRSDMTAHIAPLGLAYEEELRIGLRLRGPYGRSWVKLQWQAVPLHGSFNPLFNPIHTSPAWLDSSVAGLAVNQLVDLSSQLGLWTWRARVLYHPATSPFQRHGPWMTLASGGLREADVRSVSEPPPPPCTPPDERVWIYQVTLSVPEGFPILHVQDPNQPGERTGYHVRRSDDPAPPKSTWPLVATNVVDMDAGTPNIQWTDTSGDVPPSGTWYYQVTAFNAACSAEGPF
jgi:hypothetical protein